MANTKISALSSATTPLVGTETLPVVQGGVTVKTTVADITNGGGYAGSFTTLASTGDTTLGNADTDTITQAASYVTGTQLKSAKTATNTLALAAYDVDGTAYTNLITLTASNTPTLALTSIGVGTINNMSVGATTASTGAFTTLSATGVATFSAGTALLPAITTTGDTNTGIWFPAADTIAFTEGGAESMRIDSSGNVGIGTTTPDYKLDVESDINGILALRIRNLNAGASATGRIIFNNDQATNVVQSFITQRSSTDATIPNALQIGTVYAHPIVFVTSAAERMRIDSAGNVQVQAGAVMPYAPAPAAISAAATLTNANIQAQIISATGTTYTITMPLGTTLETLATWVTTGIGYDFTVINTASGIITMAVNTGVTSLGSLTIAIAASAQFRIRRTAANTFVLYRLS